MTISINELESGMGLLLDNQIYMVMEYDHVKPAKGSAFVRVRLKSVKTGNVLERTYRTAERLEDVPLDECKMQYQYNDGEMYHFMNQETFDQVEVPKKDLDENFIKLLQENMQVIALCHEHQVLKMTLPNFMVCQVMSTEPGIRGDSSRAGNKPANIDTGATILVPLFINVGDWIRIDTRTGGQYVERVQK